LISRKPPKIAIPNSQQSNSASEQVNGISEDMPAYTIVVHLYSKVDTIARLSEKLKEASQVYSKDKECLSWSVCSFSL
jgi:hypothetical protein